MKAKKRKYRHKEIQLRAIDLFSGCGGLTLGLKRAGFRVVGAVENEPLAVETYKANHRGVFVWEKDICKLTCAEVMRQLKLRRGDLDLLAGCPPCQGFSSIATLNGKQKTKDDPRNDLVFQFLRFVRQLRPKAVMMENVPGLAKDRRFKRIIDTLEALGYRCNHDILDTANYGVPQRRRRFILLAGRATEIPFGHRARHKRTVKEAFRYIGKRCKNDPLQNLPETRSKKVLALISRIPADGGSRLDLDDKYQLNCHLKCDGFKDIYGRMSWNEVAPTITGGCCNPSKGRFLHPSRNRSITLREAAVLQSFPPRYIFSLRRGKFAVAQMIGNALPPEFIRRHAVMLKKTIQRKRTGVHPYGQVRS